MTDWGQYDAFIKDAEKDERVGQHKFIVTSVATMEWNGGKFIAVKGDLLTANNASADFTIPEHDPTKEELDQAVKDGKRRGVGLSLNLAKSLDKYYQLHRDNLKAGDQFAVETYKDKKGFVRVNRVLDPAVAEARQKVAEAKDDEQVPF